MSERHLSPADLDLLLIAGGRDGHAAADLEGHLRTCPDCQERQARRSARHAEFERDQLPRLLRRQPPPPARRFALRAALGGLVLVPVGVAALLFFARPALQDPAGPAATARGPAGVKGRLGFRLFARRGDAVFEVPAGMKLQAGDALRFVLEPAGPFLLIVSIDSAGKASVYHPFGGPSSARVPPDQRVEAPTGSVVLDGAPGPERVFALWSNQPLPSAEVLVHLEAIGRRGPDAIRDTTRLDIPGTIQTSQLLEKEETP